MSTIAKQIDFLLAGIADSSGLPLSGAIVVTRNSANSAAKAVWEDRDKTLPSSAGKSQFNLDADGRAEVFGDGLYTVLIYAATDTGLTAPIYTFEGLSYSEVLAETFNAWSVGLTYDKNAYVTGSDDQLYRSTADANIDNDPTSSPTDWHKVIEVNDNGKIVNDLIGDVLGDLDGNAATATLAEVATTVTTAPPQVGIIATRTWSTATTIANAWASVCWSPSLHLFAAVCSISVGTTDKVMTSPDGINWTNRVAPNENFYNSIVWAESIGLFVAVSHSGVGERVMTSPDGITWTARVAAVDNQWFGVTWSPGLSLLVAVSGDGVGNRVMTSPDGINWTSQVSSDDLAWFSVAWSNELTLFAAVSTDTAGASSVMTSPDGVNWTTQTSPLKTWSGIVWAKSLGLFIAAGSAPAVTDTVMTSPDGISWTLQETNSSDRWFGIAWAEELGVLVIGSLAGGISISTDAINFYDRVAPSADKVSGLCWGNEESLFVGVSGAQVTDGAIRSL